MKDNIFNCLKIFQTFEIFGHTLSISDNWRDICWHLAVYRAAVLFVSTNNNYDAYFSTMKLIFLWITSRVVTINIFFNSKFLLSEFNSDDTNEVNVFEIIIYKRSKNNGIKCQSILIIHERQVHLKCLSIRYRSVTTAAMFANGTSSSFIRFR